MNRDFSQNKVYRAGLVLPMSLWRIGRRITYGFSRDSKQIRGLQGTRKNADCFIIGNGPSLRVSDLESLSGFDTFASNRIFSVFEETEWRPDYYLAIDSNVLSDNLEQILKVEAGLKLLNYSFKHRIEGIEGRRPTNTIYINIFGKYLISPAKFETKKIRFDVSNSFSLTYSVTGVAIELAVYMGYSNIYLLGIDHTYSNYITKDGKLHTRSGVKDYFGKLDSKPYSIMYLDAVNSYYRALKRHAQAHGTRVVNATRGGALEIFPRENFDAVIERLHNGN